MEPTPNWERSGIKLTLRAARVNMGFTQEQVQKITGIACSTLTAYEAMTCPPPKKNLETLCELYGITPRDLKYPMDPELAREVGRQLLDTLAEDRGKTVQGFLDGLPPMYRAFLLHLYHLEDEFS